MAGEDDKRQKSERSDPIGAEGRQARGLPLSSLPHATLKLTRTLQVINEMQAAGVIGRYAIGGAVAATFYLEPVPTMDVDVFVAALPQTSGLIITLKPVYDYLAERGYPAVGEAVKVEDWLVQFLPPTGPLMEEGIAQARSVDVEGVSIYVLRAEHLVAIALETGRPKDKARILQFIEAQAFDETILGKILGRHRLSEKWMRFKHQFLTGS